MRTAKRALFFLMVAAASILYSSLAYAGPGRIITAPAAPYGLTVTNVTESDAALRWNTVPNAAGYKIYMATRNDSNYTLIGTTSMPVYNAAGLRSSTTYWYYIKAYNSYGLSAVSNHVTVKTTSVSSSKLVMGYTICNYPGDKTSYNSMVNNSSAIDEIATYTYTTDASGNVTGIVPTDQVAYANGSNIKPLALVTNNFSASIAKELLESRTNRQNLINNILSVLKTNGYKGVNIDFEGLYYYDRSYLTAFMSELYNFLHPAGYTVTMALPAKTWDSPTESWNGAFDYRGLANYADQFIIMAYDQHYPGGVPGPIASIGWVKNVVNYAVSVLPGKKVLLGVAAYGYDWSFNGTKAYSVNGVYKLASIYGKTIRWDPVSQSPYYSYTDGSGIQHTVWFENDASVGYKLDAVNSSGLSGIAIWRLGLENNDYWTTIRTKFER